MIYLAVLIGVLLLNIPFGYWRASTRKFSLPWVLAIHLPVPFVVILRSCSGIEWTLATLPLPLIAFFLGQYLGARMHSRMQLRSACPISGCLVMDLYRRWKK